MRLCGSSTRRIPAAKPANLMFLDRSIHPSLESTPRAYRVTQFYYKISTGATSFAPAIRVAVLATPTRA